MPSPGFASGSSRFKRATEDADEDEEELIEWELPNTRDTVLWLIDAGPKMHDTLIPLQQQQQQQQQSGGSADQDKKPKLVSLFHKALQAAFMFQRSKLVNSPADHCGILLFNTKETNVQDVGKNVAWPNGITVQSVAQVAVPSIAELKDDLQDSLDNGPLHFRSRYAPSEKQSRIHHAFGNAEAMLYNTGKAGAKRIFFVTNEDDPMADRAGRTEQHRLALNKVKDMTRRGIEFEPFLISTDDHEFQPVRFYADLFGAYSDADGDQLSPTDDTDTNNYYRRPWVATTKFEHLEGEVGARETPKRVIFSVPLFVGNDVTMGVKGYCTLVKATKGLPVKVKAIQGEDEDDPLVYKEVITETVLACTDTGRELDKDRDVDIAFSFGSDNSMRSKVRFTPSEIRKLRSFGQLPSVRILGFKPRSELHFHENVKHAYFLYPSDVQWQNSQRAFSALLQSMQSKERIAIALFCPRAFVIPCFAALLPQREERNEDGQVEPPGLYVVPLPYADDIREAPQKHQNGQVHASEEQVKAAGDFVRAFTRNSAFNPDFFPNPSLSHHYKVLLSVAFNDEVPDTVEDKTIPNYTMIQKRAGHLIEAWSDTINEDSRIREAQPISVGVKRSATDYSHAEEPVTKRLHSDGRLSSLTVAKLKAICDHYRLPSTGKKADLLQRVEEQMSSLLAKSEV